MVTLQSTRLWLAESLSVISFLAVFKQNSYFLIRFSFIFHTIILNMTFYAQQFNNIKWKIYIFIYKCFIWFVHFFYNNADCAISSKSKIKLKRYVQSMQHLFSPYFKALKVYIKGYCCCLLKTRLNLINPLPGFLFIQCVEVISSFTRFKLNDQRKRALSIEDKPRER